MEEDVAELDEVVVTGMETIKKDHMTGSASVITAKDLRTQGINSIDRILEGTIAGLNSTTLSGAPEPVQKLPSGEKITSPDGQNPSGSWTAFPS